MDECEQCRVPVDPSRTCARPGRTDGGCAACGACRYCVSLAAQCAESEPVDPTRMRLTDGRSYDQIVRWLMRYQRFQSGGNLGDGSGWWLHIIRYDHPDGVLRAREGNWIVRNENEFEVMAS